MLFLILAAQYEKANRVSQSVSRLLVAWMYSE